MNTITTTEIAAAVVAKLVAITPTHEALRSIGWAHVPSSRRGGRAVLPPATRNFDLIFGAGQPLYLTKPGASWVGGGASRCAYGCRLAIAVSYAGVEPELLEHVITADNVDLHLALRQLRDPTLAGFSNAEPQGLSNIDVDSEANVYVEHVFTIHWNQATTPA